MYNLQGRKMNQSDVNARSIRENMIKISQIDTDVMENKALIFQSRTTIEENRLLILSNYTAAFMGNRQLANANTDGIYENRSAILSNYLFVNDVEKNFVYAQINKSSLDFLEHKSKLNSEILKISEEMAEINAKLIDV